MRLTAALSLTAMQRQFPLAATILLATVTASADIAVPGERTVSPLHGMHVGIRQNAECRAA